LQKLLIFTPNQPKMKLLKLTALPLAIFSLLLVLSACEADTEMKKNTDYQRLGVVLSGANETPATTSTALGTMDIFYSKETRMLSYTVNWSGLTGAVTAMHIHGLGPTGYAAGIIQTFTLTAITKCPTVSNTSCGTYKGTFLADGVVVKEQDIINGMYYINIHTAANPGGEIRGQILFP
jgi:CHRD domain